MLDQGRPTDNLTRVHISLHIYYYQVPCFHLESPDSAKTDSQSSSMNLWTGAPTCGSIGASLRAFGLAIACATLVMLRYMNPSSSIDFHSSSRRSRTQTPRFSRPQTQSHNRTRSRNLTFSRKFRANKTASDTSVLSRQVVENNNGPRGVVFRNIGSVKQTNGTSSLTFNNGFVLEGKPFRILSGSFHYFRTHPAQWKDRLEKMKAAGLNTVMTYIPWNLHETKHEVFTFEGLWNISSFMELVHGTGLHLIVRPGSFICAEWDLGGLPSWLLHEQHATFRTSKSKSFLRHVEKYFHKLLPILAKFTHNRGGPILAFQVESEFESVGRSDPEYLPGA